MTKNIILVQSPLNDMIIWAAASSVGRAHVPRTKATATQGLSPTCVPLLHVITLSLILFPVML